MRELAGESRLSSLVLAASLGVLILVSIGTFAMAFANHRSAIALVRVVGNDITSIAGARTCEVTPEERDLVGKLERLQWQIVDSSTVTYLFQVLLLSVVSTAAYLMTRSRRVLHKGEIALSAAKSAIREAEQEVAAVAPSLAALRVCLVGGSYLDAALRTAIALRDNFQAEAHLQASLRDHLSLALRAIDSAVSEGVKCSLELRNNLLLDPARQIAEMLPRTPGCERDVCNLSANVRARVEAMQVVA